MEYCTACFLGHRKINETEKLKNELHTIIDNLITNEKVDTFFFGSKSDFNSLCLKAVTELKQKYPHIKRIYIRSAFPDINSNYKNYLLENFEGTYFPEKIRCAGKAIYAERNQEMINRSEFCIVYYNESYLPPKRKSSKHSSTEYQPKSGTAIAYEYALRKGKKIINLFY